MAKAARNKQRTGKKPQARRANEKAADAKTSERTRSNVKKASAKRSRGASAKGRPAAKQGEKKGLVRFLRDVRVEMSKVTWPTRKDLVQSTIVVLVAVAIAGAYTGVLDFVFSRVIDILIPK